jgi:hypothetical protein
VTPLVLLALAVAAPVPKAPSPKKLVEVYGEVMDPDSKCKCELTKDGGLRVVVPKDLSPVDADHGKTVPPLLVRKVEGDFVLTARIKQSYDPAAEMAEGAKRGAAVSAGVAFVGNDDPKPCMTLVHTLTRKADAWEPSRFMQVMFPNGGGSGSGQGGGVTDGKTTYLRLTRTGHDLKAEYSGDGKKYFLFATHKVDGLGDVLKVGPVAFHSTTGDFEAEFDQYEIKPLKAEEKK